MQVEITPTILKGNPRIPSDKSWIIRYMIVSRIRGCELKVRNINLCDDVLACMDCLDSLGYEMNAGESATVLRLLLPWVVKTYGSADFILEGNLPKRPMEPYEKIFKVWKLEGNHLHVEGPITPVKINNTVSSQFFSGMLLAGYDMGECVSKRYLEMTREVLKKKAPMDITIPEDYTLRAFFRTFDEINTEDEPDLVMPKVYLAIKENKSEPIVFPERIKYKESNRLDSIIDVLSGLGATIECKDNNIYVSRGSLKGGTVDSHNDHRIAIMAAMISQYCSDKVIINGAECVSKSWPNFFDEFERLGGKINVF